ncbi:MAG: hypothetical protein ACK47B_16750 [Armatimonadota bacterium]
MKVLQILGIIIVGIIALRVLGFVLKLLFGLVGLAANLIALALVVMAVLFLIGLARRAFRV